MNTAWLIDWRCDLQELQAAKRRAESRLSDISKEVDAMWKAPASESDVAAVKALLELIGYQVAEAKPYEHGLVAIKFRKGNQPHPYGDHNAISRKIRSKVPLEVYWEPGHKGGFLAARLDRSVSMESLTDLLSTIEAKP